ncbi:hypothetical protein GIW06_19485, partial [Pseudomonas syringae]|nr:hypothetical protein [Pseudomonas syringae]
AYCRIVDLGSRNELGRFDLSEKGQHTGVVMSYLTQIELAQNQRGFFHAAGRDIGFDTAGDVQCQA